PGVRQGTIASKYLADMTAQALKKLGAVPPAEDLDAVDARNLEARLGRVVQKLYPDKCETPQEQEKCGELRDALNDPFGGTLTSSTLIARLNRPYYVPPPVAPVDDPRRPAEQDWRTRLGNLASSAWQHGSDVVSGYRGGSDPYGSNPTFNGTNFSDAENG